MDRLEKDFYTVELDPEGRKVIHVFGWAYRVSDEDPCSLYRMVEYTRIIIPVGLPAADFEREYDRCAAAYGDYFNEYDEADMIDLLENYFGEQPRELAYEDVALDTPCGYYITP